MLTFAVFNRLVKLRFSLFALPFTLAGAVLPLAIPSLDVVGAVSSWQLWFWIGMAFLSARTAGMACNELIDRKIDASNPRTASRVLPSGQASPWQAAAIAISSTALFFFVCWSINSAVFLCSPVVVVLLWLYSFTKRFTSLCHFILGAVQFFGPVLAWVAVTGEWYVAPFLLGTAVWTSITANDIVYALQDYRFDTGHGLHSLPVALGPGRALRLARWLHVGTILSLIGVGLLLDLGLAYMVVVAVIAGLLRYHHGMVRASAIHSIPRAFFTCNSLVGILTLVAIVSSLVCRAIS